MYVYYQRQPEAETRKMRTESFNLRKQQTWANGKRREKYNYDKNTHTHRFQNAALNEKYHGLFSCANTLSSSFSFYLSVFLLVLRYLSSFGVAQPPVAYVIIEQTKINILHAKYHSDIPTFVIFFCTWILQSHCDVQRRWWWFLLKCSWIVCITLLRNFA